MTGTFTTSRKGNTTMNVSFVSLGCDKNRVNTEQMMALCLQAGITVQEDCPGSDVVVINTCGFIDSAKEEAIDTILSVAALKAEGQVGKILVTGCLTQRYQQEILDELPEVDGIMGTGSYGEIVPALSEMMAGGTPRRFADIHGMIDEFDRVLTTPGHYAYLRIAEGCDNRCAYCVIPSLRGKYRSRRMEDVLAEAKHLADTGVKECIVIAQDITRYGIDLYGEKKLAVLLRELCKLDFRWIRLHYLYPDEFTDELIDTIAAEEKVLPYLDIPIQHCNDGILKAMNRRDTKAELLDAIAGSEGRVLACETIGLTPPLLVDVTNAEYAASLSADILLLNMFDVQHPVINALPKVPEVETVRELKRLTGRVVGINLEPCDLQAAKSNDGTLWKMSGGRLATVENARRAAEMGVDLIVLTGNPGNGVSNELIVEALKAISAAVGDRVLLAAGKMHASGVAGEGGEKIMTPADAEAFMAAGADIILLPAPGTVPGITQEYAHRLIEVVHSRGKLALTAIGTSQEGADVATIRQIALMCKMAGADIHHIGDTGVPGMALPQNIMAYSIAIRGERHTYHKMAQSVNR